MLTYSLVFVYILLFFNLLAYVFFLIWSVSVVVEESVFCWWGCCRSGGCCKGRMQGGDAGGVDVEGCSV